MNEDYRTRIIFSTLNDRLIRSLGITLDTVDSLPASACQDLESTVVDEVRNF